MGFSRSFTIGLIARTVALAAAVMVAVAAFHMPGLQVARLLAIALIGAALWALWRHVDRTNREVARFVEAVRHRDFSQTFVRETGGGFDALGTALDDSFRALRAERTLAGEEARMLAALVEEAPAALLLIEADDRVTLSNKAARRMFPRLPGTRIADFADYGSDLVRLLGEQGASPRRMIRIVSDGIAQRAVASLSLLERGGAHVAAVAIQPIQEELSSVELAAQADLVRVLTHEIMNSMTPVVSLAGSAAALMERLDTDADPALGDAKLAIDTLSRRASGIMRFVESYRSFARAPEITRQRTAVLGWLEDLTRAFAASAAAEGVTMALDITPADMILHADADLLGQVVLNLLKNAAEATVDGVERRILIGAGLLSGGRVRLTIEDNGPGIDPDKRDEIFLPFFTSKPSGTGVGLSLARRIVSAHGGTIIVRDSALGGARFEITL